VREVVGKVFILTRFHLSQKDSGIQLVGAGPHDRRFLPTTEGDPVTGIRVD
jgi:hypothetical protein